MEEKLYMPSNIETETEWIKGISKKELKYLLIISIISIVFGVFLGLIIKMETGVIISVVGIFASYIFSVKGDGNTSAIEKLINAGKYFISQNFYKYEYEDDWRELCYEEEK